MFFSCFYEYYFTNIILRILFYEYYFTNIILRNNISYFTNIILRILFYEITFLIFTCSRVNIRITLRVIFSSRLVLE